MTPITSTAVPDPPTDDTIELPEPVPVPAPPRGSTILVMETVIFQSAGDQPTDCRSQYGYPVGSDEQPYSRTYDVGEEWAPLDVGWLKDVGVGELCVKNLEGTNRSTIPSPVERAETAAKVIELGENTETYQEDECVEYEVSFISIRPGRSCRFEPSDSIEILARSLSGKSKVHVTAFPK